MIVQKNSKKRTVRANSRPLRRSVRAAEDIEEEVVEEGGVNVDAEVSDLLFEAEDVAELVAEVTGLDVAVTADDDVVTFEVGDDQYTVEPEGTEEILESTRKALRGKKTVKASSKRTAPRARAAAPARKARARR